MDFQSDSAEKALLFSNDGPVGVGGNNSRKNPKDNLFPGQNIFFSGKNSFSIVQMFCPWLKKNLSRAK